MKWLSFLLPVAIFFLPVYARCAPNVINIRYAAGNEDGISAIRVFKLCGGVRCGKPLVCLDSACTKIFCTGGTRCNICTVTVGALENKRSLPKFYEEGNKLILGSYGLVFRGSSKPFLSLKSDWASSSADWFVYSGWLVRCNVRVGCRSRGM